MRKVFVLVEGPSEEKFILELLCPHLESKGLTLIPVVVRTSDEASGPNYKGGYVSYTKVKRQVQSLLGDSSADLVTTMLDFYGLRRDYPSLEDSGSGQDPYRRVHTLTEAFQADIGTRRFIPFFSLHEFEALLLSDLEVLRRRFDAFPDSLVGEVQRVSSPEKINDGPETHPSARLAPLLILGRRFKKATDGPPLAKEIGLETMRNRCPHFASWLTLLEEF